jgi:hypothetical protein
MIAEMVAKELRGLVDRRQQRFLTIEDAAIRSGLSQESIRRLLSSGKLTPLRPVRGRIVIDVNQLDSLILSSDSRPRKGRGLK